MKALNDNVFLKYEKDEQKEGILTSDIAQGRQATARVVYIGEEVKKVAIGDIVAISPFMPEEIKINNEKMLFIKEKYILAIINNENRKTNSK